MLFFCSDLWMCWFNLILTLETVFFKVGLLPLTCHCRDISWYCNSFILSKTSIYLCLSIPSPSTFIIIAMVMIALWLTPTRAQTHIWTPITSSISVSVFIPHHPLQSSYRVLRGCLLCSFSLSACQEMQGRLVRLQRGCIWHHHNWWLLDYESVRSVAE